MRIAKVGRCGEVTARRAGRAGEGGKETVRHLRPKQNGCPGQEVERGVGDGDTDGVCQHEEGRDGVFVRVAHEHAGEMGAIHADVDVVERTDGGGAVDSEHVVRGERRGRDKAYRRWRG